MTSALDIDAALSLDHDRGDEDRGEAVQRCKIFLQAELAAALRKSIKAGRPPPLRDMHTVLINALGEVEHVIVPIPVEPYIVLEFTVGETP